jgi:hypothetical protein
VNFKLIIVLKGPPDGRDKQNSTHFQTWSTVEKRFI